MQRQVAELGANHRESLVLLLLPWELEGRGSDCPSGKRWAAENPQAQKPHSFSRHSQPAISTLYNFLP